jgi:MATE family multidrug resistance protein
MAQPPTTAGSSGFVSILTSQMENLSASSPIAEEAIARDVEEDSEEEEEEEEEEDASSSESDNSTVRQFSMINSYRRPSYVNPGARPSAIFSSSVPEHGDPSSSKKHSYLSKKERTQMRDDERSLLRDNHLLPPKHPRRRSEGANSGSLAKRLSISALRRVRSGADEESAIDSEMPSERTALLGGDPDLPYGGLDDPKTIKKTWNEAVAAGKITTTWQREAKVLTKSSAPLILTFLLQYSLPVASIFTVGHIGKAELGAVSLASSKSLMVLHGLAWSLMVFHCFPTVKFAYRKLTHC